MCLMERFRVKLFSRALPASVLWQGQSFRKSRQSQNKETLLDIINNDSISEEQKQDAINGMINLTDMAEKETAAEILLEAKGFTDVVVSISGTNVDVVVNASSLTDAQRAQIEDVVTRKTGIAPENIIISRLEAEWRKTARPARPGLHVSSEARQDGIWLPSGLVSCRMAAGLAGFCFCIPL